jgi:peptidyl-prolyl cis-trans isomerase D
VNRISSLFGGLAVIAIAVVFILEFRPATGAQPSSGPTCAVELSGQCVAATDFWAAYRLLAPRGADAPQLRAMGLRRLTADGLVERELLIRDAERLGISVSDDDLSREFVTGRARLSLPADKARQVGYALGLDEQTFRLLDVKDRKTKKFDAKVHEKQVRSIAKMSPEDYREFQKKELIAARMRDLVRSRARVGENEAHAQFAREKSTATLSYVKLRRSFYEDTVIDASKPAIDAWAAAHKDELDKAWEGRKDTFLPECRVARHILAKVDPDASDADGAKARAKEKIERVKKELDEGKAFAEAARLESDDSSGPEGGSLGCVKKGQMVKPFEDALFAMKEGETSGVVESQFGYHLIKVDQIAAGDAAEKLGRQIVAREMYLRMESEELASDAAKEILAAVKGGKSLEDAVKAHLDAITPAKKAGDDAKAKKAKKGAADKGAPSDARTDEDHVARPRVETTLPFNASGDPIDGTKPGESVATTAFQLEKAGDTPNDVVALDDGYAVIQLKEKTPASEEEWQKNREFYLAAMRGAKQNDALVGYLQRLKSTYASELKYNAAVTEEPKAKPGDEAPAPDTGEE